ncbi:MAG: hypothetical protein AB4050_08155 [Synechococcus sp.]
MKIVQGIGVVLGVSLFSIASPTVSFAQTSLSDGASWSKHVSEEGQFSIQIPDEPNIDSHTVSIADEETVWTVIRSEDENGIYSVAYSDLSADGIEAGQDAFVRGIQNTFMDEYDWEPINLGGREIEVDGFPGKEFIGIRDNQLSVLRLYLADRRLYSLVSSSSSLDSLSQFFDSFEIDSWQRYLFEDGRFSISLPAEPNEESLATSQVEGEEFTWSVLEARNFASPKDLYAVAYTDLEANTLQAESDLILSRVGDSIIEELSLTEIGEEGEPISLGDYSGLSYLAINDNGELIAFYLYLVEQRLFAIGAKSEVIANITQYLDSFQIQ